VSDICCIHIYSHGCFVSRDDDEDENESVLRFLWTLLICIFTRPAPKKTTRKKARKDDAATEPNGEDENESVLHFLWTLLTC
jgi:hypothetical protein